MRLYFDNNVYNRPFDDQSVPRNRAETLAVERLLKKIEAGEIDLVSSFVVEAEHSVAPPGVKRTQVAALMRGLVEESVWRMPEILQKARSFEDVGILDQDAMHLGAAEYARVDYFVTSDDKVLRRARRAGTRVEVVAPLDLLEEGVL